MAVVAVVVDAMGDYTKQKILYGRVSRILKSACEARATALSGWDSYAAGMRGCMIDQAGAEV